MIRILGLFLRVEEDLGKSFTWGRKDFGLGSKGGKCRRKMRSIFWLGFGFVVLVCGLGVLICFWLGCWLLAWLLAWLFVLGLALGLALGCWLGFWLVFYLHKRGKESISVTNNNIYNASDNFIEFLEVCFNK